MNRPIINVDLDGVVFDFVGAFGDFCSHMLHRNLPRPTIWDFWTEWDISFEDWKDLFQEAVAAGLWVRRSALISGAREALQALSDLEYHIRIVTTRLVHARGFAMAASDTVVWLETAQIPYRSLAIIGPGDSKAHYEAQVIIDDYLPNVADFISVPGRLGIVFDQPWNQDTTSLTKQVHRARGWSETLTQVQELVPV